MKTFYIHTLGCKVNHYETNVMRDLLLKTGFLETTKEEAQIQIVNTCTVTNEADKKSYKLLRHVSKLPKTELVIAVGCLSQNNQELIKEIPKVNIIIGNKNKSKIDLYIMQYLNEREQIIDIYDLDNKEFEDMRLNNSVLTRALVKIEDGCENYCTYCIIPYTRGVQRSKPRLIVLEEINNLVLKGHKEIVLTGIHTGKYNDNGYDIADLVNDILKNKDLEVLRISSIEIGEVSDKLLNLFQDERVASHLHIPLQSGSDKVLKLMNRKYDTDFFQKKVEYIRSIRKDISLTTDIIVGFNGETEEEWNRSLKFYEEINFAKINVFPYSERKGTKALELSGKIDLNVRKERVKTALALSKKLEFKYMEKFKNKELTFIAEIYKDGFLYGHTSNYLFVKAQGKEECLYERLKVHITDICYPYVLGKIKVLVKTS
jgi:threonylcarbamoyladenosine tRNA methylthiotransferase MtaB